MNVRREVVRYVYLGLLIAGGVFLVNQFAAGYLYPYGEGIVVGLPATISTEYPSTIREVLVVDGQSIKKGDVVMKTTSQTVADNYAMLYANITERKIKLAEMNIKKQIVDAVLATAVTRENVVVANLAQINKIAVSGNIPLLTKNAAEESAFKGKLDAATLRTESNALGEQITTISSLIDNLDAALASLKALYDSGNLRSPVDGVVSKLAAQPGAVTRPGEPLIDLVGKERYVLAYYDVGRLYTLRAGQKVSVYTGDGAALPGSIERIDVVAGSLPPEFQSALRPKERKQLVKIVFEAGVTPPPYFSKVSVY
ncbi:MAG: HlyD family efflux transporter periplasmic adaptor subunit [Rhodoplanes sp.]